MQLPYIFKLIDTFDNWNTFILEHFDANFWLPVTLIALNRRVERNNSKINV